MKSIMAVSSFVLCLLALGFTVKADGFPEISTTPLLHLDACAADTIEMEEGEDGRMYLTKWHDAAGGSLYAYARTYGPNNDQYFARPFLESLTEGRKWVNFGEILLDPPSAPTEDGAGGALFFSPAIETSQPELAIKEVFLVAADHPSCAEKSAYNFLLSSHRLGVSDHLFDFHRGPEGTLFNETYANANLRNGLKEIDGVEVANNATIAAGLHLFHFRTANDAAVVARALGEDREGKYGGLIVGELVIYDTQLSNEDAAKVTSHLMDKWAAAEVVRFVDVWAADGFTITMNGVVGGHGVYAAGTEVSISVTASNPNSHFVRWHGSEQIVGHEYDNPLKFTPIGDCSIWAECAKPWEFTDENKNRITDGYWSLPVSGSPDALNLSFMDTTPSREGEHVPTAIDLSTGVIGGTIVACKPAEGKGWIRDSSVWKYYSDNLKEVRFPDSMTLIGESCCRECKSLEYVVLPANIVTIEKGAFFQCPALKTVTPMFPASLVNFGSHVFYEDNSLTGLVVFANSKLVLGEQDNYGAFRGTALTELDLSATGITYIPKYFTGYARSLKRASYPKTLMSMGDNAHLGNSALADIQFRSYPSNFDSQKASIFSGVLDGEGARLVYPKEDSSWAAFIAAAQSAGAFTAWDDATPEAKAAYANNFSPSKKRRPIGYVSNFPSAGHGRWFVPYNYNPTGLVIVAR